MYYCRLIFGSTCPPCRARQRVVVVAAVLVAMMGRRKRKRRRARRMEGRRQLQHQSQGDVHCAAGGEAAARGSRILPAASTRVGPTA